MSQFSAEPREGYIEAVYGIFHISKGKPDSEDCFRSQNTFFSQDIINNDADWKAFYGDVKEDVPVRALEPLGQAITISCFCDYETKSYRDPHISTERTDSMVFEEAKHS
jgi:hypothetical protein